MDVEAKKVPFTGSCHCGAVRYILRLTVPHPHTGAPPPKGTQRFYRCNCTTCHKAGQFHIRPADPEADFLVLSPLDPYSDLGDYQCFDRALHFLFCRTCGMRPFILAGEGEVVDVDLAEMGIVSGEKLGGAGDGPVKAWRPRPGGGRPGFGHYVSVNGHTIDADQDGFDMREWTEKKQVLYCDCLSPEVDEAPATFERPQKSGCY